MNLFSVITVSLMCHISGVVGSPNSSLENHITPVKMSFPQVLEVGLQHNLDAHLALEDIQKAHSLLMKARASSLPSLNALGSLTRLNKERHMNNTMIAAQDQQAINATLVLPLIAPRAWGDWTEGKTAEDVAKQNSLQVRRQIALAIAQAYLSIISQTNVVAVNQTAVETDRAHFEYAHARFTGGVGNRLDELRANQELANSEAQLENAQANLVYAREALGLLIGYDRPIDVDGELPLEPAPAQQDALLHSESLRPDLVLLKQQFAQAEQIRKHSWRDFSPNLLGSGYIFYSHPGTPSIPLFGWQLQLLLEIPLYDGSLRYANKRTREIQARQAALKLENGARQVRSEVRVAYSTVKHARAAYIASERAAQQASDALKLANAAYRVGTVNNLEVIDAERVNRDAQINSILAENALDLARLQLAAAAGCFP